jgi:hypothetical protein
VTTRTAIPFWLHAPDDYSSEQADDGVARTSPAMTSRSYIYGGRTSLAAQIAPFVEVGATLVAPRDLMQLLLPPGESLQPTHCSSEFYRLLKEGMA